MTSVVVTQTTINASVVQESVSVSVTSSPINVTISPVDINSHSAVTIGTANGLSLSGQVLSLGLSSALATGALSSTDWSTFNNKQNALGYTPVNIASADWIDLTDGGATILHSHAGSGAVWGAITGTLSDQTDLQTALNAKQNSLTFPLASNLGGTGVNNAGTLTNASNTIITGGGTVALGGFTLTVPATLTVAGLAIANVFTATNTFTGDLFAYKNGVTTNFLIGGAGNATLTGTHNVGIGSSVFSLMTSGAQNLGAGFQALRDLGSGSLNFAFGYQAGLKITTGSNNSAAGAQSLDGITTLSNNSAFGFRALSGTSIGARNSGFGTESGQDNNGSDNVFLGYRAGKSSAGSDKLYVANSETTLPLIFGDFSAAYIQINSKTTTANAVKEVFRIQAHVSTAATGASNGFGTGLPWYAETATDGTYQQQGLISTSWVDATNASRKATMTLSAYDSVGAKFGASFSADGSATNAISILGAGAGKITLSAPSDVTLTVPATGTAALLATANVFTVIQAISGNVGLLVGASALETGTIASFKNVSTHTRVGIGSSSASLHSLLSFFNSAGTKKYDVGYDPANTRFYIFDGTGNTIQSTDAGVLTLGRSGGSVTFGVTDLTLDTGAASGYFNFNTTGTDRAVGTKYKEASTEKFALAYLGSTSALTDQFAGYGMRLYNNVTAYTAWAVKASNSWMSLGFGNPAVNLHIRDTAAGTNAVRDILRLEATVAGTGVGAAGFGAGISLFAETATDGTNQQQGLISTSWVDSTNASRKAKMSLSAYDTAARLGIEIEASGTVVKIGLFGGTTAIQQVLNAYTSDGEGVAYTGVDNLQVGAVYATVADLNQLRIAYETLRASYDDLRTKLQTSTLVA